MLIYIIKIIKAIFSRTGTSNFL